MLWPCPLLLCCLMLISTNFICFQLRTITCLASSKYVNASSYFLEVSSICWQLWSGRYFNRHYLLAVPEIDVNFFPIFLLLTWQFSKLCCVICMFSSFTCIKFLYEPSLLPSNFNLVLLVFEAWWFCLQELFYQNLYVMSLQFVNTGAVGIHGCDAVNWHSP